ncbi:MAG: hypothetical protein WBD67_11225 [Terracidiphilus sp.]
MPDTKIEIPNGTGNLSMPNSNGLQIHVNSECKWCFSDSSGVFPTTGSNALPTSGSVLQTGWYPSVDSAYQPNPGVTGTIDFNTSDPTAACNVTGPECVPRSITVTS